MPKKLKPNRKSARSPRYIMECTAGRYEAASWVGLGWSILKHRVWHLFKHRRWMD